MKPRRIGLALLVGGSASFVGCSYIASRALASRLISSEGLGPTLAQREDLLEALRASGAEVFDFRHRGSARHPVELAAILASPGDPERRPTLLFLHGKGGSSAEWQPDALRALSLGYNVLLPDLRAHAPSGGTFVTYGFLEKDDLANAVEAARERFGLDAERLGVHACSAGSTVALEFAARRPEVRALWLESPYADTREMARHYLSVATGLPEWMLDLTTRLALRRALARIRRELKLPARGGGFDRVDPVRSLTQVHACVCLVHGERDELVPPRFAGRLEACLPEGSLVWRAPGAGHCHHEDEAAKVAKEEYERRWTEFFLTNLPADRS
ncbi:MAG: alpha/beta hydrolase [Thermoanaerobaculia bacterium]